MKEKWKKKRGINKPSNSVIGAGTETGRIVVEAAIEHGPTVHELSSEHIRARIVQSHALH